MSIIDYWLKAAGEAEALQHQVAYLEAAWLRAEAEADYWYAQANNPEQALKLQASRATRSQQLRRVRDQRHNRNQ